VGILENVQMFLYPTATNDTNIVANIIHEALGFTLDLFAQEI